MKHLKRSCLLLAGILILSLTLSAQQKLFTMAEATNGMSTTLAPENVKQPSWQPGTDFFWQTVKQGNDAAWVRMEFDQGNTDTILHLQDLNRSVGGDFKSFPSIKWIDEKHVYYQSGNDIEKGTLAADNSIAWNKWATLPANAENVTVDKSMNIAFTIDNNLWMQTKNNKTIIVTSEQNKNILNGQAVHRNEFGIETGIFFSPKAKYLAYYRMDQSMVNDYPIIKWDVVPAKVDLIKYPMAGGTSHEVTLCVYNPATGKTVTLQTGEHSDHYLTCVSWDPNERYIYIAILNRDQNHLWLNKYSVETGKKVATLFEETDSKYVHPMHPLSFVPGHDDEFIWWSERDGYEHLYLYNTDGELQKKLTKGEWVVNELAGFNKAKNEVIVTTSKVSPLEKHIYSIGLDDGEMKRIDKEPGMHAALCSDDGKYIFDIYNAKGIARKCVVYATNGEFSQTLIDAPDPLANYERPEIRDITIHASDGTPLYGKLILPIHFDSTKKYPVIVYLYNGPNVQLIHNSFPESGNLWYEYMAQHGYIVFSMDGRGSWNRGLDFEQVTFRHLGDVEIADQMKGVDYLKSLPYVDANRMGLHGWSYGGFMTTSIMLKHPDVFKCAVAGGPVMDWKMYEVMYTERYMDRPQDNPEGYENANLLDKVKNLKGKLLLIHGTNDNVVVWQQSIDFLKKCVDANVQLDYFVYPGYEHNVRGKDRVHLMQKITNYFDEYLK